MFSIKHNLITSRSSFASGIIYLNSDATFINSQRYKHKYVFCSKKTNDNSHKKVETIKYPSFLLYYETEIYMKITLIKNAKESDQFPPNLVWNQFGK